jgi:hypothetical protein
VNTSIDELWDAWVAEEGVKSFLAPLKYRFSTGPPDWNNPPKLQ